MIRRVRYARNVLALEDDSVPAEGPLDVAITNGLAAIVAYEDASLLYNKSGHVKSASKLIEAAAGLGVDFEVATLKEMLQLTQPLRHGRADDEWLSAGLAHLEAITDLDGHPALDVLQMARNTSSLDDLIVALYRDAALDESGIGWLSPKDRMMTIDPQDCPDCWRETFIIRGFDEFGGFDSPGSCLACGYELDDAQARENAVVTALAQIPDD